MYMIFVPSDMYAAGGIVSLQEVGICIICNNHKKVIGLSKHLKNILFDQSYHILFAAPCIIIYVKIVLE